MAKNKVVGAQKAMKQINHHLLSVIPERAEAAAYAAVTMIESRALQYVPIDTAALINSGFKTVEREGDRIVGRVGFVQSYALPLHSPEAGGKMDNWKPRPVGSIVYEGKGNRRAKTAANMNAEQGFLIKGTQEAMPEIERALMEITK